MVQGAVANRPRRRARVTAALVVLVTLTGILTTGCGLFDKKVDVLLIGDSIMNQSGLFAEAYLIEQPGVGKASTYVEGVNGSGLLTPSVYDWQTKARDLIDTYQPKVVIVLFIGNYTDTDLWKGPDGTPIPNDYGAAFFSEWGKQAEKLNATLASGGAQVDWVLPPPLAGDEGKRRQLAMHDAYVALQQRVPSIATIDAVPALGGPSGEWVWRRAGVDGGEVTVREGDSVHLTADGGRLLAREMAKVAGPQLIAARAKADA